MASKEEGASWPKGVSGVGPRLGFTVPRAFGKAVLRNRVKRRLREVLRVRWTEVAPEWDIVINPRRPAIAAPAEDLRREVDRLVAQCRKH
jgi:ribonuclease P protein component